MKKIVFTGGGSAGHVVPNLALIAECSCDPYYIGTDSIEKTLVSKQKIPFYTISCPKLDRGKPQKNFSIPFKLHQAVKEAKKGLATISPDLVFSKGGYVSLPVVLAAHSMKIPVIIHESDFSAGLANKLSAPFATSILTAFPETAERWKKGKFTGNPIRKELFSSNKVQAKQKYGFFDRPVLLVFGGGSGSATVNKALRKCLPSLVKTYDILHICGKGNVIQTNLPHYRQLEYEPDMASAYAVADYVISRAGANTIFELLALRKPALLIPLSKSSRGDQIENATYFHEKGLCHVLDEAELIQLPEAIDSLVNDRELVQTLSLHLFPTDNRAILREIDNCMNP